MWGVVVVIKGNRQFKRFPFLNDAEAYFQKALKLQEKDKKIKVGLVSMLTPFPPKDGMKKPKGKSIYWCPYCVNYREFKNDDGYRKCSYCGISDSDYHVKRFNNFD